MPFFRFYGLIATKGPKGGQNQKIVNIEGFKSFQCVKNAYIHSTNGSPHETMDILGSYMYRPPIYSLKCPKMRFNVGSGTPKGVKSIKY